VLLAFQAVHIIAGATPLTPCEVEDAEWDSSSFLQHSLQLSEFPEKTGKETPLLSPAKVNVLLEGPSTESIQPENFGSRVVHFPEAIFFCLAFFFAFVFIHEYLVSQGMRPMLARCEEASQIGCQIMCLWNWMVTFIALSMTIPISLDFTLSLNQGATASGFFLSAGVLSGVLGFGVGKKLVDDGNWSQFYVRRLMIIFPLLAVCVDLTMAIFINETATSHDNAAIWWTVIMLGQASSFLRGVTAVPGAIFWSKITIPRRRTLWMVLTQCSRNLGLMIGPGIFVLINRAISNGPRVSPRSMMAWAALIEACLYLLAATFSMLIMPTRTSAMTDSVRFFHSVQEEMPQAMETECPPEDLTDKERETVVWNMILFAFERPFSLAALEASTVMLLEVIYGWDPYYSGIVFPMVCSVGIVASIMTTLLMEYELVSESRLFLGAVLLSMISCFGLFDVGKAHVATLLLASAGIYTGATAANGISESWGSRAAKEKTHFSQGDFRLRNFTALTTSRLFGPILGRCFVDYGGRNAYAGLMLAVSMLSFKTCYDTCHLMWKRSSDPPQVLARRTVDHFTRI